MADALGIAKTDVTCHVTLLGGGFGRKSKPDYVVEAALLSKQVGKPVKIVWSREDDLQFDYFHAPSAQHFKAGIGSDGLPTAHPRTAFPPIGSLWNAKEEYGGWQANQGFTEIPYRLANLRVENGPAPAHTRIGWLRSVASIHHAYAVQSFTDELAALRAVAAPRRGPAETDRRAAGHRLRAEGQPAGKPVTRHAFGHGATARCHRRCRREVRAGWQRSPRAPRLRPGSSLELPRRSPPSSKSESAKRGEV